MHLSVIPPRISYIYFNFLHPLLVVVLRYSFSAALEEDFPIDLDLGDHRPCNIFSPSLLPEEKLSP